MFKKLKQKINEEQSPQRNALSPQQAQLSSGERRRPDPPLHEDATSPPSDRELLAGMIAEPAFLSEYTIFALDHSKRPKTAQVASASSTIAAAGSPRGSINGDGSASPQRDETQSLTQKLQQRVSSVESLFRASGPVQGLFRSGSRDNLVRSSSRDSLNQLGENEAQAAPSYDPASDIESEAEDSAGSADVLTKEQLLHRLHRVEKSLGNYRAKYSELVTAYRTVQRDKEKTQAILSQSQDKALRRIGELREELQMDQQAKKHLQEEFDAALEEKDQMITVLQTQVALLKKRLPGVPGLAESPEDQAKQADETAETASAPQSPSKENSADAPVPSAEGSVDPARELEALRKRVRRQENLLQKCKETLHTNKERSSQLTSENEALQQQLQERLQELEKMKELHTTEKTKLITQLRDAKNLIEQLEQDKGMVIAETKRQMHETLEMKEEEIAQLRARIQQAVAQKEELQEQKEKSEKAAFEELERALSSAQRAEEARRQLQTQMEMQKSSEDKISELEHAHREALAIKEKELNSHINQAVEQCREELAQAAKEKDQQAALALEEAELQKAALLAEAEKKTKDLQLELETARTRILEIESSLTRSTQEESLSSELLAKIEEEKRKYESKLAALEEMQQLMLEQVKVELTEALNQQHCTTVEELKEKHRSDVECIVKEKEQQFHAHMEDMNLKMLEKLDVKQTEMEALSSELSELLNAKQLLEETLTAAEKSSSSDKEQFEVRLQEEQAKYQSDVESIKLQHQQSLVGVEKTLKEELNKLKVVLEEKEKEQEKYVQRETRLKEDTERALEERNVKLKEIEELKQDLLKLQSEKNGLVETSSRLSELSELLARSKSQVQTLEETLQKSQNECIQKGELLEQKLSDLEQVEKEMQKIKNDFSEREMAHTEELRKMQEAERKLRKQLDENSTSEKKAENLKKEMDGRLKAQDMKMERIKQKAKEMQEKFKKRLQENEDKYKSELAKKEEEIQQKDQQVKQKILEMSKENTEGISSALSELEINHKEKLEKICAEKRQEQENLTRTWQEKLSQQEEEMQEKHATVLQEKWQEMEEISQQLEASREENEKVVKDWRDLKEELAIRETTVLKLQAELKEAAVKLESLSQVEVLFKEQVESAEKNLNQALNERNMFQDQLSKAEEESREQLHVLSTKLEDTEKKLNVLEESRCNEGEALQQKLEEKAFELQAKEKEFQKQIHTIHTQLEHYCKVAQERVEGCTEDLCRNVEVRVRNLQERVLCNQKKISELKNIILTKTDRIGTLEERLQHTEEENHALRSSLGQMTLQMTENSEKYKALTAEQENLQKSSKGHSQTLSEKVHLIQQLTEENKSISENVKENVIHISNLESIINDLKTQLARSIADREEAISLLNQQHMADLSEYKQKAESDNGTIESLQARIEDLERQMAEKEELVKDLAASIDNQSISKSEMDQVLSEKERKVSALTSDLESCTRRANELEELLTLQTKECTQLRSDLQQHLSIKESERTELLQQVHKAQEHSSQSGNLVEETKRKVLDLEKEVELAKEVLERQRVEFEQEKAKVLQDKEEALKEAEEKLSTESSGKVAELKKKAEQKIGMIRKQLMAQIDEKERQTKNLQAQLTLVQQNREEKEQQMKGLEEKGRSLEEALSNLREDHEKQLQQARHDEQLERERSLESLRQSYEERISSLQGKESAQENHVAGSTEREEEVVLRLKEVQSQLDEVQQHNGNFQKEITRLKAELVEQTALVQELKNVQHKEAISEETEQVLVEMRVDSLENEPDRKCILKEYEQKLQAMNAKLEEKDSLLEAYKTSSQGDGNLRENQTGSLDELQAKLVQSESERHKLQKDFTRLQKDLRSLRKEHEQELEYLKKETAEESDKKLKLEVEDLEMKHNSIIKQMMREFNTQMALKEKELEAVVRETIEKAQCVEAELLGSHREEASELQKVIAQKEDDLSRTVQRYEQVLQSREEEMGTRVWEVQKELEALQQRSVIGPQGLEELKLQLAEKTTQLSEARLKEQEHRDRIISLEDKIKCGYKNSVVTHLGSSYREATRYGTDAFSEPTEFEYLRKVMYEYMMGRETKTMAKVITSVLKFTPDQAQKILDREDSRMVTWLR
ncbi:golgin subfamily A member 4 isoform X3 [Denticeps clupeoides]|uniref:golgin subfamily A member 4 isoform X3 n=1 Tax=Denticeps clupeoides TaxID=299321 RepID=UPI0010A4C662|nr:golgin subfamily A member 4 isoform X3 [Denticeps clupeoides]